MAHDLLSLMTVVEGILHRPTNQDDGRIKKVLVESLLEKATSSKNLLEKSEKQQHSRGGGNSRHKEIINGLRRKIRDAAQEAEDAIESLAVGRTLSPPDDTMSRAMEVFDAANDELVELITEHDQSHGKETIASPSSIAAADPMSSKPNTPTVGLDGDALHLKERLTSQRRERMIIPIVGMGGIGKTTLARNLYDDWLVVSHFDHRAWATVSHDYNPRAILLGLLGCILGEVADDVLRMNDSELGLTLYQRLYGRRYLVVLDDVWSEKAWDDISHYLPKENRRSRILITSRDLRAAKYPDPACEEHQMRLLSCDQGWDLLSHKVFGAEEEEHCPPFLGEIGRKIARNCRGLPLAIAVIGGLLSVDRYSKDLWEKVARDVSSVLSKEDEHFSEILSLSYDHLPLHLKPCFLYMAAFPKDFEARRSKLVKLLVAEGFLSRPSGNSKSLEDVAAECLKALVDRNLLSVTGAKYNRRAESYNMHDLLRDLCVRKAEEEKFLWVFKNGIMPRGRPSSNSFRRAGFHLSYHRVKDLPALAEPLSLSRSLIFVSHEPNEMKLSTMLSTSRLARVLDLHNIKFNQFPTELLRLVNLRFLAITCRKNLPSEIWRLRNLQTLIVFFIDDVDSVRLPREAWEIPGLRHIRLKNSTIYIDYKIPQVHENLQTISEVRLHDLLASNLINSVPNVRKLGVRVCRFDFEDSVVDLSHLHKLETLKLLSFFDWNADVLSSLRFPESIKKVCLDSCAVPTRLMNVIGSLQCLEVLKVRCCKFLSEEESDDEEATVEEWELSEEDEFGSLQYLLLHGLNLVRWRADDGHFPSLRHLEIRYCEELEEIPASFGEISSLEMIEVDEWNPSLVDSAKTIRETQRGYGNESLQIRIHPIY